MMSFLRSTFSPSQHIIRLVRKESNMKVQSGPFKGMTYIDESCGSVYLPKILGLYEKELAGIIEEIINTHYERIIDIGAAEGYFAVGLASKCTNAKVIGYEMNPDSRNQCASLAKANNVSDKIDLREKCEPEDLAEELSQPAKTMILCDVEGYEMQLLDPDRIEALADVDILVELHDFIERGISDAIRQRFEKTHDITLLNQEDRSPDQFPYSSLYLSVLPERYKLWAVSEHRPEKMSWYWMKSKSSQA